MTCTNCTLARGKGEHTSLAVLSIMSIHIQNLTK